MRWEQHMGQQHLAEPGKHAQAGSTVGAGTVGAGTVGAGTVPWRSADPRSASLSHPPGLNRLPKSSGEGSAARG